MGDHSAIEWTDATWNPLTGCDRVSEGCDNCYIERTVPFRIEGRRFDESGRMGVRFHPDRLEMPLRWRKPRMVFVNSLSDLYNPAVSAEVQAELLGVMAQASQHIFQVLTKRPARMASQMRSWLGTDTADAIDPPPNVWLGTSIELDKYAFRADHLRATPAAVRWLSLEPLLGPLPSLDLSGIDWVVVGGESGPGARPMDIKWAEAIVERCQDAGTAVFVKQLGSAVAGRAHHDIDTFPASLRIREYPTPRTAQMRHAASDVMDDQPACSVCGCTEDDPCPGGCHWVPSPDLSLGELCSACAEVDQ